MNDQSTRSLPGTKQAAFRAAFSLLLLAILAGCGSRLTPSKVTIDLGFSGQTVTKVRTTSRNIMLLKEHLTSILEDGPVRSLSILRMDGRTLNTFYAPAGWSVVDFAVHPSGDTSVILTTATDVRIVRLDSVGATRSDQVFVDTTASSDPYFNYAGGIKNDAALQPALMHDAARLVPIGESLAVVLRTGRNAIVAYRLDPDARGAYERSWRTLVEPGSSILLEGITSGSFDVFGQLQNHVRICADADSNALAIAVINSPQRNFTFRAHSEFFNDPIAATNGILLSRLGLVDGRRMGSSVVDTRHLAELEGVRATGRGFMMVGRVLTEIRSDGGGWDAFAATVRSDGSQETIRVIDVNRGDILFDAVPLPSGRFVALGSTGYTQNPSGASISEDSWPLLVLLNQDASLAQNLNYVSGARQNQLNTIAPLQGGWLLGGMVNGPGTHSGDINPDLIKADGFLREGSGLPAE